MKTSNNKLSILIAAIIMFTSASVFANNGNHNADSTATANTYKEYTISDEEIDEMLASIDEGYGDWLSDVITYHIYDSDDNLIFTAETERSGSLDNVELVKLIAQSDLLMNYDNTLYYRLNSVVENDWVDVAAL